MGTDYRSAMPGGKCDKLSQPRMHADALTRNDATICRITSRGAFD
jgi:hypothetical protein